MSGAAELALPVSLNVSGVDAFVGSSLPTLIAAGLERHRLDAGQFGIEITESFRLENRSRARSTSSTASAISACRSRSTTSETGWSSLTLLERLPATVIKLDQTYVGRAATDPASLAIVRSTIALAHALGLLVVAEGIENEPTRQTLSDLGCERGQGYHFSEPLPLRTAAPPARYLSKRESRRSLRIRPSVWQCGQYVIT